MDGHDDAVAVDVGPFLDQRLGLGGDGIDAAAQMRPAEIEPLLARGGDADAMHADVATVGGEVVDHRLEGAVDENDLHPKVVGEFAG